MLLYYILLLNCTNQYENAHFVHYLLLQCLRLCRFIWPKLLTYNVSSKVFNIIREVYNKTKSCIMMDIMISDYYMCTIGVRQSDNVSPVLIALLCLLTILLLLLLEVCT